MVKQSICIELDDETIRELAELGPLQNVITRLADSAAIAMRRPDRTRREQTDASLRVERNESDATFAREHASREAIADEVLRIARQRADRLSQVARNDAEGASSPGATTNDDARSAASTRSLIEHERSVADALLKQERAEKEGDLAVALALERQATDTDLKGERAHIDSMIFDQGEANEQLVGATLRAQELAEVAEEAQARAERSAIELRTVAEFREQFIGILGHDLRNPLGSITLSANLMLRAGRLAEEDAASTERILRAANRMTRMIAQLLDLTRARLGGGLPIEPIPIDLRDVCRNVVEEFAASIELEFLGDLTGVWDKDRLAEVLSNITGNAIAYAAPGTPVSVRGRAEGPEVVVEIINQGDTIPADVRPFIFEPFRRAQQRERSAAGNLGLGLYIARQIVLAHGGTLDVHSAEGTTTFVMRLPREVPS